MKEAGRDPRLFSFGRKDLRVLAEPPDNFAEVIARTGTRARTWHSHHTMTRFRFVTPHRQGKWYPTLALAQRFAAAIGAGFLELRSGQFVAYPGVRLETWRDDEPESRDCQR